MGKVLEAFTITARQQIQDVNQANNLVIRWRIYYTHVPTGTEGFVDIDRVDVELLREKLTEVQAELDSILD